MRLLISSLLVCPLLLAVAGCGAPTLYPISGKITLGGAPRERLIVYFRPVKGPATPYNLGVGETDKEGTLRLTSAAGAGLAAGEYKVTFTCLVTRTGVAVASGEKPDDAGEVVLTELVADDHADRTASETTSVRFTVKRGGENHFAFDVPKK